MDSGVLIFYAIVVFLLIYGLTLAGIILDDFNNKNDLERASGMFAVFACVFIVFIVGYTQIACKTQAMIATPAVPRI